MTPTGTVPPPASRARRAWWAVTLVPLVLGLLGWWSWSGGAGTEAAPEPPPPTEEAARAGAPPAAPGRGPAQGMAARAAPGPGPGPGPGATAPTPAVARTPEDAAREAERTLWEKRLERAKRTLETYVSATRYPPQSRPSSEQVDQMELPEPERTRPLSRDNADVQLRLKQDRVFVVGSEAVHFLVGCEDAQRQARPCQVVSASASEAEHMTRGAGAEGVPLAFLDDGSGGDPLAGDGTYTGRFQPSKQGFPMFSGTLRVAVRVRSGKAEGTAFFDILYTPSPPAQFTGRVREVVEGGSLQLLLGVHVRKAGRYVVAGRVDDESGVPFAHVSFNEELREGTQEVKLTVAGNLVLDESPTFPLKLRDVEGFLLKESGDPDRELMTTLRGYVHTTNDYPPTVFSPTEWQSEERTRYVEELTRDVKEAEAHLDALTADVTPP
ncbi:choice-of-anchor X domain-containing protein [Pyxidicoccus xibeiensis]|uniref:choice-of-anchor X domain-containing protein n=1 Tax=Pyxidicoccus xibeiensis TaxID=2906759 RepID=UPI0020A7B036|nr:choice-of-anchor X domain-containing protein [Pyxidicoccus xibeiensis]MCP3138899.1 hypothetical protein [Pyxidicoccus xibeiensis]